MDRKTIVKRIEEALQASDDNTVELRVDTKLYRVRYDDEYQRYDFDELSNKNYEPWATHDSEWSVNELVPWLRACIGQFKEPIWDTLLPDPKKAGVK